MNVYIIKKWKPLIIIHDQGIQQTVWFHGPTLEIASACRNWDGSFALQINYKRAETDFWDKWLFTLKLGLTERLTKINFKSHSFLENICIVLTNYLAVYLIWYRTMRQQYYSLHLWFLQHKGNFLCQISLRLNVIIETLHAFRWLHGNSWNSAIYPNSKFDFIALNHFPIKSFPSEI